MLWAMPLVVELSVGLEPLTPEVVLLHLRKYFRFLIPQHECESCLFSVSGLPLSVNVVSCLCLQL